jgi:hypothetical protein
MGIKRVLGVAFPYLLVIVGLLLFGFSSAWGAEDEERPGVEKDISILVVAYVGPGSDSIPNYWHEEQVDHDSCLRAGRALKAMWQGSSAVGDIVTHCVTFTLRPRERRHS